MERSCSERLGFAPCPQHGEKNVAIDLSSNCRGQILDELSLLAQKSLSGSTKLGQERGGETSHAKGEGAERHEVLKMNAHSRLIETGGAAISEREVACRETVLPVLTLCTARFTVLKEQIAEPLVERTVFQVMAREHIALACKQPTTGTDQIESKAAIKRLTDTEKAALSAEIQKIGRDPTQQIETILKNEKVRIIVFGESHGDPQMREFGIEIMSMLAKKGITHLAIEKEESSQGKIDDFYRTGNRRKDGRRIFSRDLLDLLVAARAAGIKIVAVDNDLDMNEATTKAGMALRDAHMAKKIQQIFDGNAHARVLFWGGKEHHVDIPESTARKPSAASLLKQKYGVEAVVTIAGVTDDCKKDLLCPLLDTLKKTLLVPTRTAGKPNAIGDTAKDPSNDSIPGGYKYRHWDHLIMFPPAKPQP